MFKSVTYEYYFGGANLIPKQDFITVNGYSNMYFGWGMSPELEYLDSKCHTFVSFKTLENYRKRR